MDPISCGLPHRAPFVFVDEIVALEPGRRAICRKTFATDEPFFRGHFPGDPLVPGVILAEALAQTAGLAAGAASRQRYLLSAIRLMKFLRPVRPGDEITLSAVIRGEAGALVQFDVTACVGAEIAAEGAVVLTASA